MSHITSKTDGIGRLEELAEGGSGIHTLSAFSKLFVTLVYIILVVSFSPYDLSGSLVFLLYPVIITAIGEIPGRLIIRRLLVTLPFVAFAGISNLLLDRAVYLQAGGLVITYGMLSGASILFKMVLTVWAVLLLIATTPFLKISRVCAVLPVPELLVTIMELIYRYLSVLLEEAVAMYHGYILRCPGAKGIRIPDMGAFLGQLILRSMKRAERIYDAMKCRGYHDGVIYSSGGQDGRPIGLLEKLGTNWREMAGVLGVCGILIVCRFINISQLLGSLIV